MIIKLFKGEIPYIMEVIGLDGGDPCYYIIIAEISSLVGRNANCVILDLVSGGTRGKLLTKPF